MTKKKTAVIIITALVLCAAVLTAAACTEEITPKLALEYLSGVSEGVAVADVSVTVTDSSNAVIYSYPEPAQSVPADIQSVVTAFVPDMNGNAAFNYDPLAFTGTAVAEADGIATFTAQISDLETFLGVEGDYSDGTITATIDVATTNVLSVDISYVYNGGGSDFTVTLNAVYNY